MVTVEKIDGDNVGGTLDAMVEGIGKEIVPYILLAAIAAVYIIYKITE